MAIRYLFSLLLSLAPGLAAAQPSLPAPSPLTSVAFHYGAQAPWDELRAFDLAIVEPDHLPAGALPDLGRTRLAAYVSLGEVQPTRAYAERLPGAWLRGENSAWGSRLIDQSQPAWPAFFAEQVVGPLWQRGLRTFFVDTLDSYQLFARTAEDRAVQEAGMVAVIRELVRRYPGIRFVYNRGFEILPQTHEWVDAVAAESLFRRYDTASKSYVTVPEADRAWLLTRLREVRERYRLPAIAIDYVPPAQRELARETARAIRALGFVPWVATPALDTLGVSSVEVMPRKVLVVHSPVANEFDLRRSDPVVFASMPLQHLGYVPEFVDSSNLPGAPLAGRYAGVVIWLGHTPGSAERERLLAWLEQQKNDGVPLSFINQIGFLFGSPLATRLGLAPGASSVDLSPVEIERQDAILGFESRVRPPADGFFALKLENGTPLLTLRRGQGHQVAAALTSWGGYVIDPYSVTTLPGTDGGNRWVINPFEFFRRSLRLPDMPVPDVTTESGRRMLLIHMDGDGFVSRSELPGKRLAGEELRDRVVRRYPLPMTLSVIEAELSPQGLYPNLSAQAEKAAREIFSAPHVAIASHSYTHPFNWSQAGAGTGKDEGEETYHLKVPGYRFDLQREIEGSVRYIESRLAPPGKKVEMFLWTGDCVPGADAVEWTQRIGLLNMNGGDTVATRSYPTVARVEGLGLPRGRGYQVFAPNQNENVYTNNWRGPYYGFDRVIETYEFTEKPRRLKPINLYFHAYLLTKRAGMQSFDRIMAYAQGQETTPVHAADYARKVQGFQHLVVARTAEGWRIRGATNLRTLRLPAALGPPDLARSRAVAGYRDGAEGRYIHLSDAAAELVTATRSEQVPRLVSANARISAYTVDGGVRRWTLDGQVPLEFTLADAGACRVSVAGRELQPVRRQAALFHYALPAHAARPLEAICQR